MLIYYWATPTRVVYFWRPGCPYCTAFTPIWDAAVLRTQCKVQKINIYAPTTSTELSIYEREKPHMKGVPHVVKYSWRGREVFKGDRTIEFLNKFINH